MKYAVEMGSGALIYIKIGSGNDKLIGEGFTDIAWLSHKPTFSFSK
jgi:hypothetical protein